MRQCLWSSESKGFCSTAYTSGWIRAVLPISAVNIILPRLLTLTIERKSVLFPFNRGTEPLPQRDCVQGPSESLLTEEWKSRHGVQHSPRTLCQHKAFSEQPWAQVHCGIHRWASQESWHEEVTSWQAAYGHGQKTCPSGRKKGDSRKWRKLLRTWLWWRH